MSWDTNSPTTRLEVLAHDASRTVVSRSVRMLQGMREGHLQSADAGLRDSWDEICVQVQGERSVFWDHYEDVALSVVCSLMEGLTRVERHAIWLQTANGQEWVDESDPAPSASGRPYSEEDVAVYILEALLDRAADWSNKRIRAYLEGH